MSDGAIRVVVIALAVVVIGLLIVRAQRSARSRPASSVDLSAVADVPRGFVVFTSDTCPTCIDARAVLDRVLGPDGYVERRWEDDADALARAGIDEVPLIVVVGRRQRVWAVIRGVPGAARLRAERVRTLI